MAGACEDCRKLGEEIYWTHFKSIHFCQFLVEGFDQQLTIPKKFADNLKDKLPDTVALKGPSGITWNVELTTSGDTLFFKNGWKEFAEDHSLEENDFLIFRYNENSHFDVLMFDQQNLCEKEATYFVRKCGHKKVESGCRTKREARENSMVVVHESLHDDDMNNSSHNDSQCTLSKKPMKADTVMPVSSGQKFRSQAKRKTQKKAHSIKSIQKKRIPRGRGRSTSAVGKRFKSYDSVGGQTSTNRSQANYVQYVSNRRPVTEQEKEKTLQLALSASSKESFIVVMRPTHVYKRFFLTVPSEWRTKHLSCKSTDVILRHEENTWCTRYCACGRCVGLSSGWKHFAVENNLEEFDVCLFEPGGQMSKTPVLDVSIFRVVQEVVPPTCLTFSA